MNETKIKTRLGLIVQGLVREDLNVMGITFTENYQYDPNSQEPDFLMPNENNPRFVIEVYHTEARNSL